uniref:p1 protein n=1 Tax=Rice yellow mottle virus TaxID=31744 RepID=R4XLI2_9VIRU|nr:putative movement protein and gene silencing suppressor [Rice yellow mottle virus]CCG97784.1 P1 protein [Rice yellow mottle virus]
MTRLEVLIRPTERTAAKANAVGYTHALTWVWHSQTWDVDAVSDPVLSGDFNPDKVGWVSVSFACTQCTAHYFTSEQVKFFTNIPSVHYDVVCADCERRVQQDDEVDREHQERNAEISACNARALSEGRPASLVYLSRDACDIPEHSETCRFDKYLNF